MNRKGKENIVKILMRRDGLSKKEASDMYEETRSELMDAIEGTSCLSPDDVLEECVGLEPDYLFDFL